MPPFFVSKNHPAQVMHRCKRTWLKLKGKDIFKYLAEISRAIFPGNINCSFNFYASVYI